ncbi:Hint domain-containing protein [Pseudoponticoccus marisrubri]|uniref:Hedgehog/Intein (Hint) domain-containing protein n=1 Tax=Pseudoponticoccus marisrubri TaxID=1685382 RepID=A0A0W7WN30_9RHOB|nr:Hint domain-containing protein [Pseudoponticoccus marisrubri]KUF12003.1 hypothetical protein AVJ23_05360 [Pseudoponticoccus marisrubri]
MADTSFLINGFSVLGGAKIRVRPKGGNENEGGLQVRGGDLQWDADDIVRFEVSGATPDGGVTQGATITGITVYDTSVDYLNDVPKFTYSGAGSIRSGNAGVGDNYLRLNLGNMSSSDPGAPSLNQLFLAAGSDLTDVAGGETVFFDQFKDNDYNQNDTIDGIDNEPADGVFHGGTLGNDIYLVLCFARGTLIECPDGPRYIETLRAGDAVTTLDHGPQPIRWIGGTRLEATGPNAPVEIGAGELGNLRALRVSQNHRLLVRGARAELLFGEPEVLVAAKHLVDGKGIRLVEGGTVDYYHFLFDRHEIVFAECCPAESLFLGAQTLDSVEQGARDEIIALFPELQGHGDTLQTARPALRAFEAQALRQSA